MLEYTYKGNVYRIKTSRPSSLSVPKPGDKFGIMIDPEAPYNFYLIRRDRGSSVMTFIAGLLILLTGIGIFLTVSLNGILFRIF